MTTDEEARERVRAWIAIYERNHPGCERTGVSYESAPLLLSDLRILAARPVVDEATEWEYAAGYQGDNGVELRWFALNGPFSIKEAAEYEITKYADDPQVRLIRRPRPGPWELAALTPDGQEKNR